jgi:hypothetical protein
MKNKFRLSEMHFSCKNNLFNFIEENAKQLQREGAIVVKLESLKDFQISKEDLEQLLDTKSIEVQLVFYSFYCNFLCLKHGIEVTII